MGSLAWAQASAFGYLYTVSAWSGYVFLINFEKTKAMLS